MPVTAIVSVEAFLVVRLLLSRYPGHTAASVVCRAEQLHAVLPLTLSMVGCESGEQLLTGTSAARNSGHVQDSLPGSTANSHRDRSATEQNEDGPSSSTLRLASGTDRHTR